MTDDKKLSPTPESPPEPPKDSILVADDSKPNRDIIVQNLKRFDFDVIAVENGKKAWEALQSSDKNIVAIFSDIMMPEISGMELLALIRTQSRSPKIPVVLVTASVDRGNITEAKRLGVNGFLIKPITSDILQTKIKELFPGRKFTR